MPPSADGAPNQSHLPQASPEQVPPSPYAPGGSHVPAAYPGAVAQRSSEPAQVPDVTPAAYPQASPAQMSPAPSTPAPTPYPGAVPAQPQVAHQPPTSGSGLQALREAPELAKTREFVRSHPRAFALGAGLGVACVLAALLVGAVLAAAGSDSYDELTRSANIGSGTTAVIVAAAMLGGGIFTEASMFGMSAGVAVTIPPIIFTPVLLAVLTVGAGVAARRLGIAGGVAALVCAATAWVSASLVWAFVAAVASSSGGGVVEATVSILVARTIFTLVAMVALPVGLGVWTWNTAASCGWVDSLRAALRAASMVTVVSTIVAAIALIATLPKSINEDAGTVAALVIIALGATMVIGLTGAAFVGFAVSSLGANIPSMTVAVGGVQLLSLPVCLLACALAIVVGGTALAARRPVSPPSHIAITAGVFAGIGVLAAVVYSSGVTTSGMQVLDDLSSMSLAPSGLGIVMFALLGAAIEAFARTVGPRVVAALPTLAHLGFAPSPFQQTQVAVPPPAQAPAQPWGHPGAGVQPYPGAPAPGAGTTPGYPNAQALPPYPQPPAPGSVPQPGYPQAYPAPPEQGPGPQANPGPQGPSQPQG